MRHEQIPDEAPQVFLWHRSVKRSDIFVFFVQNLTNTYHAKISSADQRDNRFRFIYIDNTLLHIIINLPQGCLHFNFFHSRLMHMKLLK